MSQSNEPSAMAAILGRLSARWADYQASVVDTAITPLDDMAHIDMEHYLSIGVSAIEVLTEIMLLERRVRFERILDLPCGGGRVTRHLKAFFPEAEIVVSDLDKAKQSAVASQFGVAGLDVPGDFSGQPTEQFDLIVVGSLLTHLDAATFRRAFDFVLDSLVPDGIAMLTTHGRTKIKTLCDRRYFGTRYRNPYRRMLAGVSRSGFGFDRLADSPYATSLSLPSWASALVECHANARLVMVRERGWADHQDIVAVRKVEGEWTPALRPENQLERLARHLGLNVSSATAASREA
jgi:SAM-dependent methyltransferase